ncbi:NAD(P)H nitroreductase [Bosea thiooxidans]|uniref:Putative NAD(P)H nitroreductase n=1 Tax=Bosea thiooxidans TaxID=53254 RepID=A0A0Q3I6T1_9HYPH|nr:nitroreductase [Bosea thiooxidans]KQK30720.1 NAD(P)H nitroreductase [Bosea thiooxidans]SKC08582.1 Nitroreductase [Bosea thiooxidans]
MTDTLSLLKLRRSVPPQFLSAPGPQGAQLDELLAIAARVPDHGKLAPWRFIVFTGAAREKAAAVVARVYREKNPQASEEQVEFERKRLLHAPVIVGVVSRARQHVKIPLWEQELSAGAVCMNMLVAAYAMGYAGSWLTNWFSFDREIMTAFGLAEDERMAGFIHIGTPTAPISDRDRPVMSEIVSYYGA